MEQIREYYNARPSEISNLGKDLHGAKRMNFDTYETNEEREKKQRKKAIDKGLNQIKEQLKDEIFKDSPDISIIKSLLVKSFITKYDFDPMQEHYTVKQIVQDLRSQSITSEEIAEFNKMIRAYNSLKSELRYFNYGDRYISAWIQKTRRKFSPKHSFTENTGQKVAWNSLKVENGDISKATEFLKKNARAVQFGNSVPDNEREYILIKLADFIQDWQQNEMLNKIDLSPVGWSFGARGKAGSVAYYEPDTKIISVNRNNIGSIIHELGHYIDYSKGGISRKISIETIKAYRDSIKDGLCDSDLNYYSQRVEIFARAFEAYCFRYYMGFDKFAQCGKMFLPELNSELIELIESALK